MSDKELFEEIRNIEEPVFNKVGMEPTYFREIRLSRAFARAVNTYVPEHYMAPEVKKAWDDLIAHYKIQMDEGVQ